MAARTIASCQHCPRKRDYGSDNTIDGWPKDAAPESGLRSEVLHFSGYLRSAVYALVFAPSPITGYTRGVDPCPLRPFKGPRAEPRPRSSSGAPDAILCRGGKRQAPLGLYGHFYPRWKKDATGQKTKSGKSSFERSCG